MLFAQNLPKLAFDIQDKRKKICPILMIRNKIIRNSEHIQLLNQIQEFLQGLSCGEWDVRVRSDVWAPTRISFTILPCAAAVSEHVESCVWFHEIVVSQNIQFVLIAITQSEACDIMLNASSQNLDTSHPLVGNKCNEISQTLIISTFALPSLTRSLSLHSYD